MNYRITYGIWAGLFALCAGLGFIPEPEGAVRTVLTVLSVAFFVPGALLLFWAHGEKKLEEIRLVRNLSAWSLLVTVVLLVANLLSAMASTLTGNILYGLLVVLATPLVCSQNYALSLFLWACLLMASLYLLRHPKK